uniref:Uncharacterized protein n=1 Tax=Setaria viridis TaxID=4556 RepID=A0A4U6URX6_SETVI|nr:hypothetical protein SEVIR_4G304901v2 [Setaria viridis]
MTGGISGRMEARSNKWDDSRIESLKKKKNQLESEMSELGSPRELQRKELAISEKITGLEKKLQYLNVEHVGLRNTDTPPGDRIPYRIRIRPGYISVVYPRIPD